ncbi:protein phosphatase 1 regulatory subunit 12A-like isoform X11 [Homarus americanus]|uniref:protein phosphatase 1 regulatory subunit 12A-like isoform X11 n=1 Tax=Homarus americanus TaxID=6706 RepID=UPI001C43FD69|nr:protein phosphatase 1 regulatory subunit 12A-like isoform X11 [Homarus americanus]
MAVDNRSTSALFKRAEQLRRWQESETNKQEVYENSRSRKVNFSDGCIFLAACAAGDKQEVLRLLEKGADIDTANVDGLTALHAACIDDNLDMVEFLVDQGTDVNRGDMEGWTPLHATASCGFNSIAKFLIDRGADLSLVNNDGDLAIDIADSDEMESLLQREIEDRGIDCDASRNEEERRMLEDAQSWLSNGYLADRPHPKTGAVALHVAAAKGYNKVMNLLIEAGADINSQDMDGWTPLHAAAHWGQRDAVEILCENNADMDVRNFVGQSAFDVADNNLLRLMDELKRKQAAQKLVKPAPRKRKTSPHREHSNKKEREDQRESDGTSGDESSSDVEDEESSEETTSSESSDSSESDSEEEEEKEKEKEKEEEDKEEEEEEEKSILGSYTRALSPLKYLVEKKNKVNKENATPQIIPTSVVTEKSNSRTLPQARADNTMDESEVQSWRRPSSLRKTNQEDKNQKEEVSRTIPTPARVSNRESEDTTTGKRVTPAEKDERNHMDSMEPLVSTSTVLTTNTSPSTRSIGSNVTTLTTNGGLTALPPPPKTAPTLSIPPKQPNQQHLPSPTATTSLPIVTVTPQTPPTSPTPSTPPPPQTPSSAQPPTPSKMSPGSVIKNFFNLVHSSRSFVPPSRDEESETQRKAHAKMVRSTRRSTQGVTLEDIKSAEQFMKNKQQQVSTSSPEPKETSSASTVPTSTPQGSSTTTPSSPSSKPKPESPTKADEEERRPSWRLKVDDADKNRFSLENVRSKDKAEVENDTETVTVQLRRKNTEEKADEDKESERNSQTREGTQAAIQRRKKPKRRSTGRVQVNIDDIDPEKRAQRSAEQQQQADEGSEEEEEEEKPVSVRDDNVTVGRCCLRESVNERGDTVKGSTTSLGSAINSQPSSRSSSIGPENGDIDYKKLYEEQLEENFKVRERLRGTETELRQSREAVDLNTKKCNTRLAMAEADKREKRALERKLSEMEEELKQLQKLKAENEKLRAENRALTRVVSKLTNSATAGMGNLANLSK